MRKVGIVLGAAVNPDGSLPPHTENRAKKAIERYSKDEIQHIITTGKNESEPIANYIVEAGIPGRDVHRERESRSTIENFYFSKIRFLEKYGLDKVEAYTQRWHKRRALFVGERILGEKYSLDVIETLDGRIQSEIEKDRNLEKIKFVKDSLLLEAFLYNRWPHEMKVCFGDIEEESKQIYLKFKTKSQFLPPSCQ